jgi:hypothetical protein
MNFNSLKQNYFFISLAIISALFLLISIPAMADVTADTDWTVIANDTTADADEVMGNFDVLAGYVNSLDADVDALETDVAALEAATTGVWLSVDLNVTANSTSFTIIPVPKSCTMSKLRIYLSTNMSSNGGTAKIYVGAVLSDFVITLNATTEGLYSDTTNTASLSEGDLLKLEVQNTDPGATNNIIVSSMSFLCQ